jgi:enoyl-CoA hydratase
MLITGDTITGAMAAEWGLALTAVPADRLDAAVEELADRIAGVPINQLVMQKLMINQAYDNMGLAGTEIIATLFDGVTRTRPRTGGSRTSARSTASTRRSHGATPAA